ncbi:MAG TPA: ABC transporter permease, partial [Clostridiales bacterium]|nr:ABC transporter permease [Clostridiales bacterium]
MNIMHKITLKGLKKNKTRTVVTIIGVVLSLAMITAVTTFASSIQNYLRNYATLTNGNWHARVDLDNLNDFENIINDEQLKEVAITKGGGYALLKGGVNEYKPYLYIMELDKNAFETLPIHLTEGRLPENSNEVLLSNHISTNGGVDHKLASTIELELGKRTIDGYELNQKNPFHHEENEEAEEFQVTSSRTFTVVGFFDRFPYDIEGFSAPGYSILTTSDESQAVSEKDSDISIYLKLKNIRKVFDLEMEYYNQYEISNFVSNYTYLVSEGVSDISVFTIVLYGLAAIIILLIMIGSIALIYNSFSISISERRKQFGLLSSVGATQKQLVNSVLFESLFISLIGIPIGIVSGILGIGVTLYVLRDNFMNLLGDIPIELTLYVSIPSIIVAIIIGLLTILISA